MPSLLARQVSWVLEEVNPPRVGDPVSQVLQKLWPPRMYDYAL